MDHLKIFLAVMEAGGFTAAAVALKLRKSAVSQQIAKLEQDLGIPLFKRTTRRVIPTDEGRALYARCEPLLRELDTALEDARKARFSGSLRITAPADYTNAVLARALVEFGQLHPKIAISLITESRVVDLIGEGVDLGIRLGWPADSSLRQTKLGEFEPIVVASPRYMESSETPIDDPRSLSSHSWVELTALPNSLSWRFTKGGEEAVNVRVRPAFSTNDAAGVLALVRAGAGVSVVTDFSVAQDLAEGRLVRVLADWRLPTAGIFLVWPDSIQESPKLRALIEHLRRAFIADAILQPTLA